MASDIEKHERVFYAYARALTGKSGYDPAMALKIAHTEKVVENARFILATLEQDDSFGRSAILGALYHDVGRFEQYLRHHTFRDAQSCNHGQLGARIMKKMAFLTDESPVTRREALLAVLLHNRFSLPAAIAGRQRRICELVRDADKLDILRVMDEHINGARPGNTAVVLGLPDSDGIYSENVINDAISGTTAAYADLRSVNDFRLLLGTWYNDLSFAGSRQKYIGDGHARRIILGLPASGPYAAARAALLERIFGESGQ